MINHQGEKHWSTTPSHYLKFVTLLKCVDSSLFSINCLFKAVNDLDNNNHQWRIYGGGGGGGGLGGLNPPLGLPSKNWMCIEKRHHNMSRPTLCSYSTLSQAQPQTIGFKPPPPPLGCQVNMWRYHGLLFMVSIALVDARKTSLTGVQNSKKNWLAATRLGHQNSKKIGSPLRGSDIKIAQKKSARHYAARTSNSTKKIGSPLRGSDIKIANKIGSPLRGSDIKIANKKSARRYAARTSK